MSAPEQSGVTASTWPYGTRKKGWIVEVLHKVKFTAIVIQGDDGEGYAVFQAPGSDVPKSQSVIIEFTEGGHTGGYWRIVWDSSSLYAHPDAE